MIHAQASKYFAIIQPQAIFDNTSPASAVIDTLGWDYLEVVVMLGATDIALTALKLQESDATSDANTLSSGADITGMIFGTSANIAGSTSTLPSATDDNKFFIFQLPCGGPRKRYIDLLATIGDGAAGGFFAAFARLSRGTVGPDTAAEQGASQILRLPA